MTQHPDLFAALAAPFEANELKLRSQAGRQMPYVTARTIMNRLDDVLGPENWWDDFVPLEHSVICRMSIRLPDGTILTKCDAGGYAGLADPGDDDKSGFADAFKRTAVKFGVGRATSTVTAFPRSLATRPGNWLAQVPKPVRAPPSGRPRPAWPFLLLRLFPQRTTAQTHPGPAALCLPGPRNRTENLNTGCSNI